MCIVLLSTSHPKYPFILLSNRDEFLSRPTAIGNWWDAPNQHVLGGRDLQRKERGTWLAITKQGRIAALTNFREEGDTFKAMGKSRGGIVNAYLTGEMGERPQEFAKRLIEEVGVRDVGGFSLLFGELRAPSPDSELVPGLSILSNRSATAEDLTTIATKPGEIHGLSNSHFGDTSWPKVVLGERLLQEAIAADVDTPASQDVLIESLFNILSMDKLPKRRQDEDWDAYVYHMRESILIPPTGIDNHTADKVATAQTGQIPKIGRSGYDTPDHSRVEVRPEAGGYGTQKQTVILVDQGGTVKYVERTLYNERGIPMPKADQDRVFEFAIEGWRT
jgi:uncharacterized protein with NRDE domain